MFKKYILGFIFVFIFVLNGCQTNNSIEAELNNGSNISDNKVLKVHYIDTGQSDSILIQSPNGKTMLIDAGETKEGAIKNYITSLGINNIDIVVATHPHNDHISEMPDIINSFGIGTFYMPDITTNTKIFERMIDAIKNKNVKAIKAKAGMSIDFDNDINCDIVAPCSNSYDSLNNWSIVIHMTYGQNSFLFTGDAEELSEKEILSKGFDIKSDVLKAGHHGSRTSTSKEFLDMVNPKIAIISAGLDNDYGHPHKEIIDRLKSANIEIYSTFEYGTIIITSDGTNLSINDEYIDTDNNSIENSSVYANSYIGNKKSKKFHLQTCSNLPNKDNQTIFNKRDDAISAGYSPCSKCNP